MANTVPTTIEELKARYSTTIKKLIYLKSKKYILPLSCAEDIEQEFYLKCITNNLLEKYDPTKAAFQTYLDRIITGVCLTLSQREQAAKKEDYDDDKLVKLSPLSAIYSEKQKLETGNEPPDIKAIIDLLNKIPKKEERLLLKLKFYCEAIPLTEDERAYLAERMGVDEKDVEQSLKNMQRATTAHEIGLKNKDICRLLPYQMGSVSTLFKRLVRKYILDQYIYLKNSTQ